jgi:hypothetical protein
LFPVTHWGPALLRTVYPLPFKTMCMTGLCSLWPTGVLFSWELSIPSLLKPCVWQDFQWKKHSLLCFQN